MLSVARHTPPPPPVYVIRMSSSMLRVFSLCFSMLNYTTVNPFYNRWPFIFGLGLLELWIYSYIFGWMYCTLLDLYWVGLLALRVAYIQPYSDFSVVQSGLTKSYYCQQCKESSICFTSLSVLDIFILAILAVYIGVILQFYFSSSW